MKRISSDTRTIEVDLVLYNRPKYLWVIGVHAGLFNRRLA